MAKNLNELSKVPPWLLQLLTPTLARAIARRMAQDHPGMPAAEIAAKMRADLGASPDPAALDLVAAVEERLAVATSIAPARSAHAEATRLPSALVLLLANLVPLYGVVFLDWPVIAVLVLFWLENVIVGLLNVARMLCADPSDPAQWAAKLFMVPFFCVHYGMFTAVHGVFVFGFFGETKVALSARAMFPVESWLEAIGAWGLWPAAAVLAASHLFSFFWNFLWRGEYRLAGVGELMGKPYGRVVVLHVTIIFGGIGVTALGSPVWALVLLVALKTAIDLYAHLREHRARAETGKGHPAKAD